MSTIPSRHDGDVTSLDDALRNAGGWLAERHPRLENALVHARDRYARAYVWARVRLNEFRYDAPIEPYRLLDVDPDDIEYAVELTKPKFRYAGEVVGGDWDVLDTRFEDMDVYRAYEAHFEHGVPWEETAFFARIVDELEAGAEKWGCRTRSDFEARCARLDRLYESIRRHGYRTQDDLLDTVVEDPIKPQARLKTERLKDEIAVHVGRDGDLLFEDGRNRLSIVKLLDLDAVPVRVLRRHERWQAVRDAYVAGDPRVRERGDHPDLRSLEFDSTS